MSAARSVLLLLCFAICASAETRTLVVYAQPADGLESLSSHYLELELRRVLVPAGIELVWESSAKNSNEQQPSRLVVGSFTGNCSVETLSSLAGSSSTTRTLGDTSVSNDRILPYFRVDCGRIIRALAPILQPLSVPSRESIFGRALARVIAHEIYHIVAQTEEHDDVGLAKAQLSLQELLASRFDLSPASVRRMQTPAEPESQRSAKSDLAALAPAIR